MSKHQDQTDRTQNAMQSGASVDAIRYHYDVGNDFFRLWLDSSMTYSAALWTEDTETLESAQEMKRDFHIEMSRAKQATRVLDIGCGWGAVLADLANKFSTQHCVGLTLSAAQKIWIDDLKIPSVEVRLESWKNHRPQSPYDAIISVGAFEHFVRPDDDLDARQSVYRDFFQKCHSMLKPGGWLSLQTQAYLLGEYTSQSPLSAVFPESDMPKLHQILHACDRLFEPEMIVNIPSDYIKTLDHWISRFERNRQEIVECTDVEVYERYLRFLKGGLRGYSSERFMLLRLSLRRIDGQ